jgi:hypothetical protein
MGIDVDDRHVKPPNSAWTAQNGRAALRQAILKRAPAGDKRGGRKLIVY